MRRPDGLLPATVTRTGKRQLSVTLTNEAAAHLEQLRKSEGARSWGEVIRLLIERSMRRAR